MRALLLCTLAAGVLGVGFIACNPNSIGRPCVNPEGSDVRGTQVSSPALECPSRLCLITPPNSKHTEEGAVGDGGTQPTAVCTATCETSDDCDPETKKFCKSGFACAVVTTAGPFCCRKLCVCREDLQLDVNQNVDGGIILPHSCDPNSYAAGETPQCANVKVK